MDDQSEASLPSRGILDVRVTALQKAMEIFHQGDFLDIASAIEKYFLEGTVKTVWNGYSSFNLVNVSKQKGLIDG